MSTENIQVVHLWCNGSCQDHATDGERAGYGVAFRSNNDRQGEYEVAAGEVDYGSDVTAAVAHYKAIINGLEAVREKYKDQKPLCVELRSNAENTIRQINGTNEVTKSHLIALHNDVCTQLDHFEEWTARYVDRRTTEGIAKAYEAARDSTNSSRDGEVDQDE